MTAIERPPAEPPRELLRPLRLFGIFFRISALNELQYRANLAIQLFQSLIALATGLAVLALVFGQTNNLAGWTQSELLVVMGVHILMGGVIRSAIQPNMERLMGDVRQGTLDYILTKPEDSQLMISVREFRIWQAVDVDRRRDRPRLRDRAARNRHRARAGADLRGDAAPGRRDDLLLLADPHDRGVLDRPDGRAPRAVRRDLPVRALAGDDLSGLAADRADVSRPDRVRGHACRPRR